MRSFFGGPEAKDSVAQLERALNWLKSEIKSRDINFPLVNEGVKEADSCLKLAWQCVRMVEPECALTAWIRGDIDEIERLVRRGNEYLSWAHSFLPRKDYDPPSGGNKWVTAY